MHKKSSEGVNHGGVKWQMYVQLVKQCILLMKIRRELRAAMLVTRVSAATYKAYDVSSQNHLQCENAFRHRHQAEKEKIGTQQNKRVTFTLGEHRSHLTNTRTLRNKNVFSRPYTEPTRNYEVAVELVLSVVAAERGITGLAAPGSTDSRLKPGGDGVHRVVAAVVTAGKNQREQWSVCRLYDKWNHDEMELVLANGAAERGITGLAAPGSLRRNERRDEMELVLANGAAERGITGLAAPGSLRRNERRDEMELVLANGAAERGITGLAAPGSLRRNERRDEMELALAEGTAGRGIADLAAPGSLRCNVQSYEMELAQGVEAAGRGIAGFAAPGSLRRKQGGDRRSGLQVAYEPGPLVNGVKWDSRTIWRQNMASGRKDGLQRIAVDGAIKGSIREVRLQLAVSKNVIKTMSA